MLRPQAKGLGFGVGKEPLVSLFASLGCTIVATDQSFDSAQSAGWSQSNQFAGELKALNEKGLCDPALFEELVTFRTVDMRAIPQDLSGFDFTWSSCAFEHLGSISEGLKFVLDQMKCLRVGGIAVHTTEFNVSSNSDTITTGPTVLFRRRDIEDLARHLRHQGNLINLDFTLGATEADLHVDSPPWSGTHLRLKHDGYTITSFGLVIQKGQQRSTPPFLKLKLQLNRH
ncbi:MAG: SAM-dependent methyltransferase [Actinomycetota bacterium]|nr:MAG: SAM-dependent methyltransferase [Actinomycetota bacterium]